MPYRKYIAEFLGTLILTLAVTMSLAGTFPVATPVIAGLAVGACVYTFGSISGTHINPAITIGLAFIRKISPQDALMYIAAQLIGAAAAMQLASHLVTHKELVVLSNPMVFASEIIGTFILATGVAAVVHGKVSQGASGLTIGGSLLLGISLAATGSNGVLNPAVALGIGSLSLSYLVGPIIGSVIAMLIYNFLAE